MTTPDIIVPIVHNNGTSREELSEQLQEVYAAIEIVFKAMGNAAPNGRDYYPSPGLMDKAIAQHRRHLHVLTELQGEIDTEIALIEAQGKDRA